MPDEPMWATCSDAERVPAPLAPDAPDPGGVEFGCGHGTFTGALPPDHYGLVGQNPTS